MKISPVQPGIVPVHAPAAAARGLPPHMLNSTPSTVSGRQLSLVTTNTPLYTRMHGVELAADSARSYQHLSYERHRLEAHEGSSRFIRLSAPPPPQLRWEQDSQGERYFRDQQGQRQAVAPLGQYMGSRCYREINASLRNGHKLSQKIQDFFRCTGDKINNIDHVLAQGPSEPQAWVYRTAVAKISDIDRLRPGMLVQELAYLSTTRSAQYAEKWGRNRFVQDVPRQQRDQYALVTYVIEHRGLAKDFTGADFNEREQERILHHGSCFLVRGVSSFDDSLRLTPRSQHDSRIHRRLLTLEAVVPEAGLQAQFSLVGTPLTGKNRQQESVAQAAALTQPEQKAAPVVYQYQSAV